MTKTIAKTVWDQEEETTANTEEEAADEAEGQEEATARTAEARTTNPMKDEIAEEAEGAEVEEDTSLTWGLSNSLRNTRGSIEGEGATEDTEMPQEEETAGEVIHLGLTNQKSNRRPEEAIGLRATKSMNHNNTNPICTMRRPTTTRNPTPAI